MKPFDLEAALRGEPCVTRDGNKAYIKYVLPEKFNSPYPLQGYAEYLDEWSLECWTSEGTYLQDSRKSGKDIIGMWEDPPQTVSINGHEFPKPCVCAPKPGEEYFFTACSGISFYVIRDVWDNADVDRKRLNNGTVHQTFAAAEAHADALNAVHKELIK